MTARLAPRRSLQALDWRGISSTLRHTVWAFSVLAVARFLSPAEVGMVTVALIATQLFAVLHRAVAQDLTSRQRISLAQSAGMFWLSAGSGLVALLTLTLSASLAARFFSEPLLALLLPIAGLVSLLDAVGMVPAAILERYRRHSTLAVAQIAAGIAGLTFALALAANGAGAWSLLYGRLLGAGLELTILWWYAPLPLRMRPVFSLPSIAAPNLENAVAFATNHTDKVMLAMALGCAALGLYQLAAGLVLYPLVLLSQWLAATLCPTTADRDEFRQQFLSTVRAIALISFPLAAVLIGTAANPGLIDSLVDGSAPWTGFGAVLVAFSALAALLPIYRLTDRAFQATRGEDAILRWSVASLAVTIAAAAFALPWGPWGVALAVTASSLALMVPATLHALSRIGLPAAEFAQALRAPFLASLATAVLTDLWLNRLGVMHVPPAVQLFTAAGVSLAFYVGLLRTLRPVGIADLALVIAQLPAPLSGPGLTLLGMPQPAVNAQFSR